jgi:hypothetical protein
MYSINIMHEQLLLILLLAVFVFFASLNIQLNSDFLLSENKQTSSCSNFISTPYLADPTVFDLQDKELTIVRLDE